MSWLRSSCQRLLWFGAMLLIGEVALAAEDAGDGPVMREVQVAPDSFSRGAPLPSWVKRQDIPATQRREPLVMRLRDTQVQVGEAPGVFVDRAIQVNDRIALGAIGQERLEYLPPFQRMNLHSVRILRGDAILDRTGSVEVRFLERETGLEQGVYRGSVTVALLIPDVRVGDTLSIAYFVEGANPVFAGKFFDEFGWDGAVPTELRRVTLTHPSSRKVQWRMLGDYRSGHIEPKVEVAAGWRTVRFEERAIEAVEDEPLTPSDYFKWRILQVSEFADWNEVARWASGLFPNVDDLPKELETLLSKISTLATPAERVAAANRWVQGEIRNFSVSLGESSHKPHPPAFVLEKRYGDCKDKTYLLLTMLRRLGVEAVPLLVSMQSPRLPGKILPSPWPFDHVVVRARVDGRTVYLEPTGVVQTAALQVMAQPPSWMLGLPADLAALGPVEMGTSPGRPLVSLDIDERFTFSRLGAEGTLDLRKVFSQGVAEILRSVWPSLSPEQRRQVAMEDYEKRWPGMQLIGGPTPIDDLENNRFGFAAQFKVPQLAQPFEGGWLMRYGVAALRGLVNLPPSQQRKFPVTATEYPLERRHSMVVQWPQQVSAMSDPVTQAMRGRLFDAESRTSFRGSRYEFRLRLVTKGSDLMASELPDLSQDLKRLDDLVPGVIRVTPSMIARGGSTGQSTAVDAMSRKFQERLELASGAIRSGLNRGDELARAHCSRAGALAKLERVAEALADTLEAIRIAPDLAEAWSCRGEVLFRNGDFVQADEALSRGLGLGTPPSQHLYYLRGMVRAYLGRYVDAAADLANAGKPDEDGEEDLYARLWQIWSLQRAGTALPADLQAMARKDPSGDWPRPALAMLAGALTPQQLLADVDKLEGDERILALAEAWFYIGQHHLVGERFNAAREAFEKCRAQGITSYYEHTAAGFELERLAKQ